MKRAYKYRFYPTPEQAELLAQTFGCVRFVYNSILRWRTDAYYELKEKIGYLQANARLTALKKESEHAWLNDVSCLCDFEPVSLPITASTVGIDVGLKDLFVTDTGFKTGNLRYTAKIADCRMDNLHKLSRKLINENQVVCVESLKVKNMIRNPKLSKAIADASWSEFVRQLQYKGEWAGRSVVAIDQYFPSSKRCSCYGFTMQKMPLDVRKWHCPECGADHDRDVNAARNIKAAGLAVLAHGATVNPEAA
ncbi:transposase [Salmonella enterica subsp. enterica serovar Newport]|nr:transposase [Salmonella enterica subsp. enterica serovar Newport]